MGYYKDSRGVDCFEPDNTEIEFWLAQDNQFSFNEIIEMLKEYFKVEEIDLSKLTLSSVFVHTNAIYYDCFDRTDWTNYICFTYKPSE